MATAYKAATEAATIANGDIADVNGTAGHDSHGSSTDLFAPPTPLEIAQRLAALKVFESNEAGAEANIRPLDISGDRSDFYGYTERVDAQR